MNGHEVENAYGLYIERGTRFGTPLTRGEFEQFWAGLNAADRGYWQDQFHKGPTTLTRELSQSIDSVDVASSEERIGLAP